MIINNRYRLISELGKGGMGVVYRALDRLTQHEVALKQVLVNPRSLRSSATLAESGAPTPSSDRETTLVLAHEFQVLASLRHPNIISVLDYGFDESTQPFFTMTLIDGARMLYSAGDERDLNGRLALLTQVLLALDYLHRRGVIHHDLKPGNILVDPSGQVRVLDFGLAVDNEVAALVGGTMNYLAPEVLRGFPATFASDLYAVGVILCELVSGAHPYDILTPGRLLIQLTRGDSPDVSALPPELQPISLRLLLHDPDDRYPNARAVIEALADVTGSPPPAETATLRESFLHGSRLIGRDDELVHLRDRWRDAKNGHGATVLIGGQSGVGKSRLVDALAIRARVEGGRVLVGQAPREGGSPYSVWVEVIRRAVLMVDAIEPRDAAILREVLPEIERLLDLPPDSLPTIPPLPNGDVQRDRLTQTILALLQRIAQPRSPLLLIFEDMQWALESRDLLSALHQQIADLPILILITYRADETPDLPAAFARGEALILSPLGESDAIVLCRAILGDSPAYAPIIDHIVTEARGNVYLLTELLDGLARGAGGLDRIDAGDLPPALPGAEDALIERLRSAPAWAWALIDAAAIAGRQIDRPLLTRLAGDLLDTGRTLDDWLDACVGVGILRVREDTYFFYHDRLRERCIDRVAPQTRADLHRRLALALEALHPDDPNYDSALHDHWRGAGDDARERQYAERLADTTKRLARFAEALPLYERALALTSAPSADHARLLMRMGEVNSLMDNRDLAVTQLQTALDEARATGARSTEALALAHLAMIDNLRGDNVRFEQRFEESYAISIATDNIEGQIYSLKQLAMAAEIRGEYPAAMARHERALALAQSIADEYWIGSVINDIGIIHALQGQWQAAEAAWQTSLDYKRRTGDRRGTAATLGNLGLIASEQGNLEEALRYQRETLELTRAIGTRQQISAQLNNLSSTLRDLGLYYEARAYQDESIAIKRADGDMQGLVDSLTNMAVLDYFEGDDDAVIAHGDEVIPIREALGDKRGLFNIGVILVAAHLRRGSEREVSAAWLRWMVGLAIELDTPPTTAYVSLLLAWWAADTGDLDACAERLALWQALTPNPNRTSEAIATPLIFKVGKRLNDDRPVPDDWIAWLRAALATV